MFTWECPKCGREVDISETECPHCASQAKKAPKPKAHASAPPPAAERGEAKPLAPKMPPRRRPARKPAVAALQPAHWGLFAATLAVCVTVAVYLANPNIFGGAEELVLEDVPEVMGAGVSSDPRLKDVEVSGVRTFYDEDLNARASAVVTNHSEEASQPPGMRVLLRPRQASTNSPPLATFEITLEAALAPREARDVEVDLSALGTLASLPPWSDIRVDLEPL